MPSVQFKYDEDKDAWNILRVTTQPPKFDKDNTERPIAGLPEKLVNAIHNEYENTKKEKAIKDFLHKSLLQNKTLVDFKIQLFNKEWEKINNEYFKRLVKLLDINILPSAEYSVYLTHAGSCPFNAGEKWLMVRIVDETVGTVVAHEIMHIELNRNYGLYFKNLGLPGNKFDTF